MPWNQCVLRISGLFVLLTMTFSLQAQSAAENQTMTFWLEDPYARLYKEITIPVPDKSLWNAKRIKDYQESLWIDAAPPVGLMKIDDLNIQIPIYNGTEELNLNRGIGRIKGMARMNDETGNLGIAGHRDGIFRPLKDIQVGDDIIVETPLRTETFLVSSITIVPKDDISVLAPTDDRTMTIVTCYPFYHVGNAPKRYIVKAKAVN
jgi:LPXTG-site transpeptidase (sortase) family protein